MGSNAITELTATLDDGTLVFWRGAPAEGMPTVYVHGVPTSSDDWLPFLERTGGVALDLPGFGRSGKRGDFDYSIAGYNAFFERFLDQLGFERINLVVHDWGAAMLAWAQRRPERVERLVVADAVPLLPGYQWHRIARIWRTPVLGELFMGMASKRTFRWISRAQSASGEALPDEMIDSVWSHFDPGTQRAILHLYRSAPPDVLEATGERLDAIQAPALVVWGERDPYIPTKFGRAYAERLPNATYREAPGAGHWPWLDQPALVEEICEFLISG